MKEDTEAEETRELKEVEAESVYAPLSSLVSGPEFFYNENCINGFHLYRTGTAGESGEKDVMKIAVIIAVIILLVLAGIYLVRKYTSPWPADREPDRPSAGPRPGSEPVTEAMREGDAASGGMGEDPFTGPGGGSTDASHGPHFSFDGHWEDVGPGDSGGSEEPVTEAFFGETEGILSDSFFGRRGDGDGFSSLSPRRRRYDRPDRYDSPSVRKEEGTRIDLVRFSALTDKRAEAGMYQEIDIFMYTDEFRYAVDEFIASEGRELMEKGSGYQRAALGTRVTVILESHELAWSDKEDRFWNGGYQTFTFAAPVPESLSVRQIRFRACVYLEDVLSCVLNLIVPVSGTRAPVEVGRRDIRSAFISYSSMDRAQVASIVFGMKKVRPDMDIFFDVESLRSGTYWEKVLKEEIGKRDILYLCWSRNAKRSEYVEREWRWAYKNKGLDGIEPVPLEAPALCPPPAELNRLHFGDLMVYVMDAARAGEASLQCVSEGTVLRLKKGSVQVGKDISNDLVVRDERIGNRQFSLSWNGSRGFYVRNLDPAIPTTLIMDERKKVLEGSLSASVTVPCIIKAGPSVFLLQ